MKIEVKGIKHLASMSQETYCYEATLYIDGTRAALVGNEGHGGPTTVDALPGQEDLVTAADSWVMMHTEPRTFTRADGEHVVLYNDITDEVDRIVYDHLNSEARRKALMRMSRKNVVMLDTPDSEDCRCFPLSWKHILERAKTEHADKLPKLQAEHPDKYFVAWDGTLIAPIAKQE